MARHSIVYNDQVEFQGNGFIGLDVFTKGRTNVSLNGVFRCVAQTTPNNAYNFSSERSLSPQSLP
jgi:hypothetical protein